MLTAPSLFSECMKMSFEACFFDKNFLKADFVEDFCFLEVFINLLLTAGIVTFHKTDAPKPQLKCADLFSMAL